MKLHINGHTLRVVAPGRGARNRDIIRLQEQSGLTLEQIGAIRSDLHGLVIISFLTQANAGMEPDYQALMDGDHTILGQIIREPGDDPEDAADQPAEEVDPEDPPLAGSATPEPAGPGPEGVAPTPETASTSPSLG